VPITRPRLVLAPAASVAPVPPLLRAMVVALHVPLVTVPRDVRLELRIVPPRVVASRTVVPAIW